MTTTNETVLPHLHEDLHTVQRGGSGAGHGTCHGPRRQLLPPQTSRLLLLCELVRDGEAVTDVQHLRANRTRLNQGKYVTATFSEDHGISAKSTHHSQVCLGLSARQHRAHP